MRAVFLDRDDTLIDTRGATAHTPHPGDLVDPSAVRLLPGVAQGLGRLQQAGYRLVVTTSQGGVARGVGTLADVERVNDRLRGLLAEAGVRLAGVYACPFHPRGVVPAFTAEHPWRKPGPGMILTAADELGIDLRVSAAVGDMARDAEAALAAGIPPDRVCLVESPKARPANTGAPATRHPLGVCRVSDLSAFADLLLMS